MDVKDIGACTRFQIQFLDPNSRVGLDIDRYMDYWQVLHVLMSEINGLIKTSPQM